MSRQQRAAIAEETVEILERGHYHSPSGRGIDISTDLEQAISHSRLFRPLDFPVTIPGCDDVTDNTQTFIEVTAETTLEAAQRLASTEADSPCCLNFASAKNPGGGFLSGSQAQEESLARSSGLYACIAPMTEMYQHNRRHGTCLYSDYMIYSPAVPVFRDDSGELLDVPYKVAFITSPAVNTSAVKRNEPKNVPLIRSTLASRLEKVLWLAAHFGHRSIILGAWGCGVFGNDPVMIAELFAEQLGPGGKFRRCFRQIVYAVYDTTARQEVLSVFRTRLVENSTDGR